MTSTSSDRDPDRAGASSERAASSRRAGHARESTRQSTRESTDPGADALAPLLARAAQGDSQAWREVVASFAPRVHALLRVQCRDAELAEEIAQSAFCTVAAKIGDYVESGRFESWLFRIAVNRLRDEMRRRARHARPMGDEAMGVAAGRSAAAGRPGVVDAELRTKLETALARLPDADREIVELRHTGGMSFRALSDYYDEPLGTLLARHHRALKKLKAALEALGVDATDLAGGGGES